MKKYSSRLLRAIAKGYLVFPVLFPLVSTGLYGVPFNKWVPVFLSPFYYILCASAMMTGYGLSEMRRWGWYLFTITNLLIIYYNALIAATDGLAESRGAAFLGVVFAIVFLTYRVSKEIRVPYFFPRIRWWESNPQYKLCLPALVKRPHNEEWLEADILDISPDGCFLKFGYEAINDEPVEVEFKAYGLSFHCSATVVWRTQTTVTLPKGVGVKFGGMTKTQKRRLKILTQHLEKISTLNLKKRYILTSEEFEKQLEALQKTQLSDAVSKKRLS